jgi:hypothetical protein
MDLELLGINTALRYHLTSEKEICILNDSQAALLPLEIQTNQILLQDNTNISITTKTCSKLPENLLITSLKAIHAPFSIFDFDNSNTSSEINSYIRSHKNPSKFCF